MQNEPYDGLGGYDDESIWKENRFVSMNQAYKMQLKEYSNKIKHKQTM